MKSFTSIAGLGKGELLDLIDSAITGPARSDDLSGRAVALLFFENSTRTRLSFELAGSRVGADVLAFDPDRSSVSKGESLRDTVMTVSAIGSDILVVRHQDQGVPDLVQEWTGKPVINAGDGAREHPTQALTDLVTLTRHFGQVDGLKIAVVGDVLHSRVAGSLSRSLPTLGAQVTFVAPDEFVADGMAPDIRVVSDMDSLIGQLDVVYLLRVQRERGAIAAPDYEARYQMNNERASGMKEGAVVLHPGPMNRGVEITDDVADGPRSLILDQVANGVPTRMAVLRAIGRGLM